MNESPAGGQQHAHFHFHVPADLLLLSDFHWHLHVEPSAKAPSPETADGAAPSRPPHPTKHPAFAAPKHPPGQLGTLLVIAPTPGSSWNVRPATSGGNVGCVCSYGNDTPGGNAPSAVLAYIYTTQPSSVPLTPDPGAVCGFVDVYTGNWFFTHDKPAPGTCSGTGSGSGRLGSEIPGAQCSAAGADNWLVIWIVQNGSVAAIYPVYFKGVTASGTNCQASGSSGAMHGTPVFADEVPPPLPTCFLLHLQPAPGPCAPCAESAGAAPVPIRYCEEYQDGLRPVWRSTCGDWSMTATRESKVVSAVIQATNVNVCGKLCSIAWTGMIVSGRKQHYFAPFECAAGLDGCPCLVVEAV